MYERVKAKVKVDGGSEWWWKRMVVEVNGLLDVLELPRIGRCTQQQTGRTAEKPRVLGCVGSACVLAADHLSSHPCLCASQERERES